MHIYLKPAQWDFLIPVNKNIYKQISKIKGFQMVYIYKEVKQRHEVTLRL